MILAIRKRMEEREEGFTLIELLVVVIIIGILAAIAIPAFLAQRTRARVANAESDLRNAAILAEEYAVDNSGYTGLTAADVDDNQSPDIALAINGTPDATTYCISATHQVDTAVVRSIDETSAIYENATCT